MPAGTADLLTITSCINEYHAVRYLYNHLGDSGSFEVACEIAGHQDRPMMLEGTAQCTLKGQNVVSGITEGD